MTTQFLTLEQADQLFAKLEQRIDVQEQLLANLILAYTEVHAVLVTLMGEITDDEEKREQFAETVRTQHKATLEMIQRVSREMEQTSPDDPTSSIVSMVGEHRDHQQSDNDTDTSPSP